MDNENPLTVTTKEPQLDTLETDETEPQQKEFSLVEHLLAIILICGFLGVFNLISLGLTKLLALLLTINEVFVKMVFTASFTIVFLTIFYIVNRDKLERYLLKRKLDLIDLLTIIGGLLVIIGFSIIFTFVKLGSFSWLPVNQWLETFFAALYFGISEELVFRSILLVYLGFWLAKIVKDEQWACRLSGIIVILLFSIVWHIRYILSGEFLLFGFIFLFAIASTIYAVERKKVVPFLILHVAMNIIIFLCIGGTITQL